MTIILNLSRCTFLFFSTVFGVLQYGKEYSFLKSMRIVSMLFLTYISLKQKDHLNGKSDWYMILEILAKNKIF